METIFSDGKTLEIEQKLKITVFLPQLCHFCTKEITTFESHKPESLVFHSLDGDHDNWDPANKVPSHHGCHQSYHMKQMERWVGDKNPMSNPETVKKLGEKCRGEIGHKRSLKAMQTRRDRYGPSGMKPKSQAVV